MELKCLREIKYSVWLAVSNHYMWAAVSATDRTLESSNPTIAHGFRTVIEMDSCYLMGGEL